MNAIDSLFLATTLFLSFLAFILNLSTLVHVVMLGNKLGGGSNDGE